MDKNKIINWLAFINIFCLPLYIFRVTILKIPTNLFEVSTILLLVTLLIFNKKYNFYLSTIRWGYLLLVVALIAVFFSPNKLDALGIWKGWFFVPILFCLNILNWEYKNKFKTLFWSIFLTCFLVILWSIAQKIGVITTLFYQSGDASFNQYLGNNLRVFGPFESPNFISMFLVPLNFILLALFKTIKDTKIKILLALELILSIVVIFWSQSEAGLLAIFAGAGFYILWNLKKISDNQKASLSLIILIIGALAGFYYVRNADFLRFEIYKYSYSLLKNHWILGLGLGNFQTSLAQIIQNDNSFILYGLPYALHPHNFFLAFWLYLGILGFLTLIFILVNFYKRILGLYKDSLSILLLGCAMTTILIQGLFDTTYFKNDLSAIFWLIIALLKVFECQNEKNI